MMPKRRKQINAMFAAAATAVTGGAAGLAGGVGVAHASNGTFKIEAGGNPYTGAFSGSNSTASAVLGLSNGADFSCSPGLASATGHISKDSGPVGTPTQVGTISKANFGTNGTRCNIGALGTGGQHQVSAHLLKSADLLLSSFSPGGHAFGEITDISAHVSASGITGCNFKVTGALSASYSNSSHVLTVDPKSPRDFGLTVVSADGQTGAGATACEGLVAVGAHAFFHARYTVHKPASLTITDP